MPQAQTFSSRQSEPTAQMTGEEKVWVAEGSLGLVRAVRATYFFARITAFFTGDAVGCQKTVMLFSPPPGSGSGRRLKRRRTGEEEAALPLSQVSVQCLCPADPCDPNCSSNFLVARHALVSAGRGRTARALEWRRRLRERQRDGGFGVLER